MRQALYARRQKINQSEKSSRDAPAGGNGDVNALRHRRDRQRGKRLLVTNAPPTPPRRWRARSKGDKQINMVILHIGFQCPISHEAGQDRPVCTRRVQEQLPIRSLFI